MAGGRFELVMEPTAIGLVSLNSNSETHMTAICDARPINGGGVDFTGIYMLCSFKRPPPTQFICTCHPKSVQLIGHVYWLIVRHS